MEQKIGFEDRLMHDCRITKSLGQDINKICYSSSTFKVPFKVKEYSPDVLDQNQRLKEFKFLGNKADKQQPLQFNFTYTFYK